MKIEVFYDKECPFCSFYSNYLDIKENHTLILSNARENIEKLEKLKTQGFNIDKGFIIQVDDKKLYQGANAIVFLNKVSKKKIYFANNTFFRKFIYPLIKSLRKVVLFILGKSINLLK